MRIVSPSGAGGILVALLTACGGNGTGPCTADAIAAPDSLLVNLGQTVILDARLVCGNLSAPGGPLSFAETGPGLLTISADGDVTGVAPGATVVAVTFHSLSTNVPVLVVTHPSGSSVLPTPLSGSPYGVAITSGGHVYVTQIGSNTLSWGDLPLTTFTGAVTVEPAPAHVAFNPSGTLAWVTNQLGHSVSVVDAATDLATATIPLGSAEAYNVIVSNAGGTVYVSTNVGRIYVIGAAVHAIIDSFDIDPVANGFAFNPAGTVLYASSRDGGTVKLYNTVSATLFNTLQTGGAPQRMAVSRDGSELYIANESLGLDIWNLATGTRDTTVAMPAYGLGLSPDDSRLYVTDPSGGTVRIVDRVSRAILQTMTPGGKPRNVAFDRFGTTALITNEYGWVDVVR